MHNGIASLREIAGLTDRQLAEVYFRKRDKHGKLVRGKKRTSEDRGDVDLCRKTQNWHKSSFVEIFQKTWKDRGLTDEEVDAKWRGYVDLPKNRTLKHRLAQRARMGRNGS